MEKTLEITVKIYACVNGLALKLIVSMIKYVSAIYIKLYFIEIQKRINKQIKITSLILKLDK